MRSTTGPFDTSRLRYRLFREGDLPGLKRLWDAVGWFPDGTWAAWYLGRHADSQPLIAVALNEADEIVAQLEFQGCLVQLGSEEARAVRLAAAILRPDQRAQRFFPVSHPIVQLFALGASAAAARGDRVLYGFPYADWLPVLRKAADFGLARFEILTTACRAALIDSGETQVRSEATVANGAVVPGLAGEFGAEHDALWREARRSLPIECGVVRSAARLNARPGGDTTIEVRHAPSKRLIGYGTVRRYDGLVVDLLAANQSDVEPVLAGVVQFVRARRKDVVSDTVRAMKVMAWPVLEPALNALGFGEDPYRFAFACASLDPALQAEAISPTRWYVAAGD